MSRRDQWKQAIEGVLSSGHKASGVEDREKVPDISCGLCKNFSANAYAADGRGTCRIMKLGSDITAETPAYVLEGDAPYITKFNMDASRCGHFDKMELIDTDGAECADPSYRRAQRQMEKALK
jgi:hypothetical protein